MDVTIVVKVVMLKESLQQEGIEGEVISA